MEFLANIYYFIIVGILFLLCLSVIYISLCFLLTKGRPITTETKGYPLITTEKETRVCRCCGETQGLYSGENICSHCDISYYS
jgi:hypothetical protein